MSLDLINYKEYIIFKNTIIKIYYINNEDDTISISTLIKLLSNIKDNLPLYISSKFLDGLTIEIWNANRTTLPQTTEKTLDIGDKRYIGLTYGWLKLIKLKINSTDKEEHISNLLSHELGHYFAEYIGFNKKENNLRKEWEKIRGNNEVNNINNDELIAEDFRLLFGSEKAKGLERGNYLQANKVKGYKQLLELFKLSQDYINSIKNSRSISNIRYDYDIDYFGMQLYESSFYVFMIFNNYYTYVNNTGVWNYKNDNWILSRGINDV